MKSIVAVGDNVVDCYLAQGLMFPGGNCLNLAVFARRFGARTAYVGAIGRDPAGQAIANALATEGVIVDRLRTLDGATAYCVIGHRRNGDRVFLKFDLAVSMFEPDAGDLAFARGFDAVHIGQSSGLDAHLGPFAEAARLSYDFSTRRDPAHRAAIAPRCFLASISGGDLGETEASDLVAETVGAGATWCLLTRGEKGALLGSRSGTVAVAAAPAVVVDTLGAGDTFIARTLVGLLRDEDPLMLLDAAARAASDTCGRWGATGHAVPMAVDAGEIPAVDESDVDPPARERA